MDRTTYAHPEVAVADRGALRARARRRRPAARRQRALQPRRLADHRVPHQRRRNPQRRHPPERRTDDRHAPAGRRCVSRSRASRSRARTGAASRGPAQPSLHTATSPMPAFEPARRSTGQPSIISGPCSSTGSIPCTAGSDPRRSCRIRTRCCSRCRSPRVRRSRAFARSSISRSIAWARYGIRLTGASIDTRTARTGAEPGTEKTLEDNAALLHVYVEAALQLRDRGFRDRAARHRPVGAAARWRTKVDGGFYNAQTRTSSRQDDVRRSQRDDGGRVHPRRGALRRHLAARFCAEVARGRRGALLQAGDGVAHVPRHGGDRPCGACLPIRFTWPPR